MHFISACPVKLEFNISLGIISPISVISVLFLFGEAKTPNLAIEQIPRMRIGMTGLFYHSAFYLFYGQCGLIAAVPSLMHRNGSVV